MTEKFTEFSFIEFLQSKFSTSTDYDDIILGNGDDAAVIDAGGDKCWVLTCDIQMEDVHFTLKTSTGEDTAHKVMAVNMSDISAMGARPRFGLLSLGIPVGNSMDTFLKRFSEEIKCISNTMGIVLLGGNVSSTKGPMFVDLFMVGEAKKDNLIKRSGAVIGDRILVTGELGSASAGLFLLSNHEFLVKKAEKDFLIRKQLRPEARVEVGSYIGESRLATAMIDISDSLVGDLAHICHSSRVGAIVNSESIPISRALQTLDPATDVDPLDFALNGGEDYELLLTVSKSNAESIQKELSDTFNLKITDIGEVVSYNQKIKIDKGNGLEDVQIKRWDHLE